MATNTLGTALGFSEEELQLNARGRLSAEQEAMVSSHEKRSGRWTVVAGIVILVSLGAMGVIAAAAAGGGPALAAVGVLVAVVVAVFVLSVLVGRRRSADLRARRISTATGRARTRTKTTTSEFGGVTIYRLKIGSTKFQLPNKSQLGAFEDGTGYTVYYLRAPGTPILLSAIRA